MPDPILSSLASLKTHLGITGTAEDALLTQILLELDEVVANETGRNRVAGRNPFESVQATEYYDGTGRARLVLRRRPVTAIANLYVDQVGHYGHGPTAFAAATEWTLGTQWAPRRLDETEENFGILMAINGVWPEGCGNIKVVNTAGYTTIPADLTLAVNLLAAQIRLGKDKGGPLKSETIGRYAYDLLTAGETQFKDVGTVRSILSKYAEIVA